MISSGAREVLENGFGLYVEKLQDPSVCNIDPCPCSIR